MLLRHSAMYLVARGVPGIVNFLAIAIYTRLLVAEEYGRYALVIAGVGLFNVLFFQWLRLALLRFLPAHRDDPTPLLSTVLAGFSGLVLLTGALGLLAGGLWPDPTWRSLLLVALPMLWAQAWFELNLELARSQLQPGRYGLMSGVKAVSALFLGVLAVLWGLGARGPLLGLLVGFLVAALLWGRSGWKGVAPKISIGRLKPLLAYGVPLTANFALAFVVSSSDRFLIAWFLGEGPAGVYAASYDLAQQSLTLLMMVVNLAAYPLAVRALEVRGELAAKQQLTKNGELLWAVALPCTVGLATLAPGIAAIFLGTEFQHKAPYLIPLVAMATLLSGIRAYHFDLAFQLGRRTLGQVWVMGGAALLNVLFNLWWIPAFGLLGAAWATVVAYAAALLMSVYLGRGIFAVPVNWRSVGKVTFATAVMVPILLVGRTSENWLAWVGAGIGAAVVYGVSLMLLDVGGLRPKLPGLLRRLRHAAR